MAHYMVVNHKRREEFGPYRLRADAMREARAWADGTGEEWQVWPMAESESEDPGDPVTVRPSSHVPRGRKEYWRDRMRKADRNPNGNPAGGTFESLASDHLYEQFHGRESSQLLEVDNTVHVRDDLAVLGTMNELKLKLVNGEKATLKFPNTGPDAVLLASSPDGQQLYLEAGDQTLDLRELDLDGPEWERDHMVIGEIDQIQYRTQKGFDDFETIDYYHQLGEETKVRPMLLYDTLNDRMSIAGGQYRVESRGIVN